MPRSKVAVIATSPEKAVQDTARAMEMAELAKHLDPAKTTILKDNITWHYYFPGANSTPWQVEGAVQGLLRNGFSTLVSVHNNTVVTDPVKGDRLNKLGLVYAKHGIPVRYNCDPEDLRWVRYEPKAKLLALPKIFPKGIALPEFFFGKNIVHLPTMKTHIYTTTTGAMKNAFGGLLNTRRHYTHTWIHETLVDLLAIQKEIHSGVFAVMDGTVAGNGPGPRTMTPVETNLILASADQVAIDAVSARIMGFDPLSIPYIRMAHEAGLGMGEINEIEILGEDIGKHQHHFTVGKNLVRHGADLFWFGPLKFMQKLLFHTPVVYLFVFMSSFYHDYFWYPVFGRRRVNAFLSESRWGTLFREWK